MRGDSSSDHRPGEGDMSDALPPELASLLASDDGSARDDAWAAFLDRYSRLLLSVVHSLGGGQDAAMDRYAYILEWLRREDYARLRTFVPDGRCQFSTWLVVVARRLCLDQARRRYGHASPARGEAAERRGVRRRLADLVGERIDLDRLEAAGTASPDADLRGRELKAALDKAIAELDGSERLLLKLRFEFHLPVREIAEIVTAPSVFHVYRRLNRTLERLRGELARHGVVDPEP